MLIKQIAASTAETFQTNYLGNYLVAQGIGIDFAAKVVPMGDGVLMDLDNLGVADVGQWRQIGGAGSDKRILPVADGLVPDKVVDITIDNQSISPLNVYMPVLGRGTTYVQCIQQTILANSQAIFRDFSALFLNLMLLEAGQITVDWADGTSHTFSPNELLQLCLFLQQQQTTIIDNMSRNVRKVTIIPDIELKVQLVRYRSIGNL